MIKMIYVDMDGVLCDFEKRYTEKFGFPPSEMRARRDSKEFWDTWGKFVLDREFESLCFIRGANKLIQYLDSLDIPKEILSSSGGIRYHKEVSEQKNVWLNNCGIKWKRNFVPGRRYKSEYASNECVLIDDTEDVIDKFILNRGNAILHINAYDTIKELEKIIGL